MQRGISRIGPGILVLIMVAAFVAGAGCLSDTVEKTLPPVNSIPITSTRIHGRRDMGVIRTLTGMCTTQGIKRSRTCG